MADKYEIQDCKRCDAGMTPWGACFKCGGSAKVRVNISAQKRRESTERNRELKAQANHKKLLENKELAFLADGAEIAGNDFLAKMYDVFVRYGRLSEKQYAAVIKVRKANLEFRARKEQRDLERKERDSKSTYVGKIGDRIDLTVVFEWYMVVDTHYGSMSINRFRDSDGNIYIWKTSSFFDAEEGTEINIRATVKEHSEFRGAKQTVITRVNLQKSTKVSNG